MRWTTKVFIQRLLSTVPGGSSVYYTGQALVGGFRDFSVDSKVSRGSQLLKSLWKVESDFRNFSAVEIGTGWTPILPLIFWLYGQEECHTYDISRLLKNSLVVTSAIQIVDLFIEASQEVNSKLRPERVALLRKLIQQPNIKADQILATCNISYHAPADASATQLPDASADLVYSNNVFEHIRKPDIISILKEAYRVLRSGGYMLHFVDLSDHFAHADPSISRINFLQFSEESFSRYNSKFIFQNRLRAPVYRQIVLDQGFEIVCWETSLDKSALYQLSAFNLDKAFKHLSPEELCTTGLQIIARRL
jgi:SAM-dependent methyltransferase